MDKGACVVGRPRSFQETAVGTVWWSKWLLMESGGTGVWTEGLVLESGRPRLPG